MDGISYSADLDADAFEAEVAPLVKRIRKPLHRCMYDADGVEREIDRVILVGGATCMPLARKMVARELRIFPDGGIDPDHAVALGAAVHAGLIAEDRALEDVVMTDVSPFSIGIGTSQGDDQHRVRDLLLPIIPRNTALPASREERVLPCIWINARLSCVCSKANPPMWGITFCLAPSILPSRLTLTANLRQNWM